MATKLTNAEKKEIAKARQQAVRQAWKEEQARVREGKGTRDWSSAQQKELLERGAVKGYDGHHMKSVSKFPQYAGDSKNIQLLSEKEHFEGAHKGSFHNATNGYYDPKTNTMTEFEGDELGEIPVITLSEKYSNDKANDIASVRDEYAKDAVVNEGEEKGNIEDARLDYVESESESTQVGEIAGESESVSNGSGSSSGGSDSESDGIGW